MPALMPHALFRACDAVSPRMMAQVCHEAVSKIYLSKDDLLFCDGEVPRIPRMYFLISGILEYRLGAQRYQVFQGAWACEGCLWVPWVHYGSMVAMEDSILLAVD